MSEQQNLSAALSDVIGKIDPRRDRDLLTVLVREVNNELWSQATFGRSGELACEDMGHILRRWLLALQSVQRAERISKETAALLTSPPSGAGPDYFGKKNGGRIVAAIEEAMPKVVTAPK